MRHSGIFGCHDDHKIFMSVYKEVIGILSQFPAEDVAKVAECVKEINAIIVKHGNWGNMAIAVIGAALSEGVAVPTEFVSCK